MKARHEHSRTERVFVINENLLLECSINPFATMLTYIPLFGNLMLVFFEQVWGWASPINLVSLVRERVLAGKVPSLT